MQENEFKPIDLVKFRQIIQSESIRLNLRSFSSGGETAFTLALALSAAVKKIFYEKSEQFFSDEPILVKKPITQFVHKMRVDAMEKFNTTTVFSVIQFAVNEEGLEKQTYSMTLLVYLQQKFVPEFLRMMQYPYIDSDEESEVKDGCGALINLIAGQYKKELAKLGYKDFMMSHFNSYINTALDGVGIPNGATEKYELNFEVDGSKRMVVEMVTLASLPKWSPLEKPIIKKILIIDDDPTFIKVIKPYLQSQGYIILLACDGNEGMAQLKEKPDLIILDLQMPNMDGYEFIFARTGVLDGIQIPIIVSTVKEGLSDITKVEGIKEYIIKPYQPEALLKTIQRHI